jgi:endonuclease/exonuclease/phosphatase family metal-dependent hydrolase
MKKTTLPVIVLGFFFLFLIQLAGTLVESIYILDLMNTSLESIYILDLMNTSLDEKALGVLFFFTPVLLYFYRDKRPALTAWILFGILFLGRGLTPYLNTLGRMLASGIGTGASLSLLPFLLTARTIDESPSEVASRLPAGMALGIGLSVFLRTVNFGLDYSLFSPGGWAGWVLGALLGIFLFFLDWGGPDRARSGSRPVTLALTGIFLVLGLAWFAFSAPSVISRWTEGGYIWIVIAVSGLSLGWVGLSLARPGWVDRISRTWLLIWNLAFTGALIWTILAHRLPFPETPSSPAVVVGSPTWMQQLPLVIMLLLFPVIFLDLRAFAGQIRVVNPNPRDLVPGTLLGSLILVINVFVHIFTNVWGYVEPISPWFRNKFWLPYALLAGLLTLLIWRKPVRGSIEETGHPLSWGWLGVLVVLFGATGASVLLTSRIGTFTPPEDALLVMTYNIQQANDDNGERSFREQQALIREVDPDILALQESDSTRISLNNNDYVRYYAGKMGYYSYFGPTSTTGTYGTAILSKFPLDNTRTVFTYSDQDEVGTAVAEVEINGQVFTIYNVHPAGSDAVMQAFAETLLDRSAGKPLVIALGDYNLRDYEEAYQLIDTRFTNAWISVYPSGVSPVGVDMSGENRIDHIFFSSDLTARNPIYILPPESATDHPVHWAEIVWED